MARSPRQFKLTIPYRAFGSIDHDGIRSFGDLIASWVGIAGRYRVITGEGNHGRLGFYTSVHITPEGQSSSHSLGLVRRLNGPQLETYRVMIGKDVSREQAAAWRSDLERHAGSFQKE